MNTFRDHTSSTFRTWMIRGVGAMTALALTAGAISPAVVAAPASSSFATMSQHKNVDWMNEETASYLTSIGMDVMVPSWVPSPFEGRAPDVYAGDGSYSLYWMASGETPTFLHITGQVGGAFPAGSKADLNVELSVNTSVQGWPAIQDIGIPAGSDTPIYDQVWWIANGVLYSVEGRNLGSDSLTIANSMMYLEAPVAEVPTEAPLPTVEEPTLPPPTNAPTPTLPPPTNAPAPTNPPTSEPAETAIPPTTAPALTDPPASEPGETVVPPTNEAAPTIPTVSQPAEQGTGQTDESALTESATSDQVEAPAEQDAAESTDTLELASELEAELQPTGSSNGDGTAGPRPPVIGDGDGTAGPRPPVIGGDGTGGLFDTALPRITIRP